MSMEIEIEHEVTEWARRLARKYSVVIWNLKEENRKLKSELERLKEVKK